MESGTNLRTYRRAESVVFRKTSEAFGGLSNMASGYPIRIADCRILTSEALYQACRFPHMPEVQRLIIGQRSPMTAKMKSKPHRKNSRPDWEAVRVPIMKWCLRIKLVQNWEKFSTLLLDTGQRRIVEESRKDDFWGAKPKDEEILQGQNVLGRLLMELREILRERPESLSSIEPPAIPDFKLYGKTIPVVQRFSRSVPIAMEAASARAADLSSRPDLFASTENYTPLPENQRKEPSNVKHRRKLIEVALPLEAINAASSREKSIRHGHPSTLHLWWARRPLAACRAVLFAQLVDDPSAHPDKFPTEEAQERERQRLFRIIEDLVLWENTTNETVLERARAEIRKSCGDDLPPVYDPFCGGGSIPLEAQRLGLKAYGSDLNPVAVMISKALVEIPPKFAGLPPVNPEAQAELKRGGAWNGKDAQGLAEDVRYYGQWMRDEAFKRIGHLYPQVDLPPEHGGGKATVIAWLWARIVECPNPACKALLPLVSNYALSTKKGKQAWMEPMIDRGSTPPSVRFEIRTGVGEPPPPTKQGRGATFKCPCCGTIASATHVKAEGGSGRMGAQLMAIVAEGNRRRVYLPASNGQEAIAKSAKPSWAPDQELPKNPRWFSPPAYGMLTYEDLFTPRQLVALTTLSDLVQEARELVLADAKAVGLTNDDQSLADGGTGAEAYADAVDVYLALAASKLADNNSTICSWMPGIKYEVVRNTFSRQALPMVWDYAECNPFARSSGDYYEQVLRIAKVLEISLANENLDSSEIKQIDASSLSEKNNFILSTDPPYYDNIGYADLSDYFYVWMRRSLRPIFPNLFGTMLVPKVEELVATPYRHEGKENAEKFFLEGMTQAIHRMAEQSSREFPATIYYAFKQAEVEAEGIASTGWATFLEAVGSSGFTVVGTWPVRTERSARSVSIGTNALASSIVLVCRKRPENAPVTTRADFLKALKRELPTALKLLQQGNIAPVDMAQASIGPGMAIFTKYSKVLESDDTPMTVKTALQLINQALDEYLSEQEAEYDPDTRFAITWFETHGMDTGPYGTAETLATARGVAVAGVVEAGILEARGGNVRLLRRDEMPDEWDPATDKRLCVWECAQHLIRVLETEGEGAAAGLLARLGARGEVARDLAYRLYGICERKKWADEARAYNGLVIAWPELTRLAARTGPSGSAQEELLV